MALTPVVLLSAGYGFAVATTSEAEVRQGKNYSLASLCQVAQIYNLSTITHFCLEDLPSSSLKTAAMILNQLAPLVSMGACPLAARVRQSDESSKHWSQHSIQLFNFIANHTSQVATAGMVTATVAQYALAGPYCAGALAAPVLYQMAENQNWVPRKVSRFIESKMPFLTSLTYAVGGTPLNQLMSAVSLAGCIPCAGNAMQHTCDRINRRLTPEGQNFFPWSLAELEAPLVRQDGLSFSNMRTLLAADQDQFEFNPAHFTNPVGISLTPAKKYDPGILVTMFEDAMIFKNWNSQIERWLIKRLAEDDGFVDFLKDRFPEESKHSEKCRELITKLATQADASEKDVSAKVQLYLTNLLKKQMQECVDVLLDKKKAKGSVIDALEAQGLCQSVIEYLLGLSNQTERDDILVQIAVEAPYCARGMKRAFSDICEAIICSKLQAASDPVVGHELRILHALEKQRKRLVDAAYLHYVEQVIAFLTIIKSPQEPHPKEEEILNATSLRQVTDPAIFKAAGDIHVADLNRKIVALGFIPLSERERQSIGVMDVYTWGNFTYPFGKFRKFMLDGYKINDAVTEVGCTSFTTYIQKKIEGFTQLTKSEKEKLIEILSLGDEENKWPLEQIQERFQRLFFYMRGTLRLKSDSTVSLNEKLDEWESEGMSRADLEAELKSEAEVKLEAALKPEADFKFDDEGCEEI